MFIRRKFKYVLLVSITCMHNAFKFTNEKFLTKMIGTELKKLMKQQFMYSFTQIKSHNKSI